MLETAPITKSPRQEQIVSLLWESSRTLRQLAREAEHIERAAQVLIDCFRKKGKVISFGNGGSAADAQHLAAELSGRFERERPGLPAIALTTNTSTLTAVANDYDYSQVFVRQLSGLVRKGDVIVAISTSGNSPSVLEAAKQGKKLGATIVGWTGKEGGKLKALCDVCLHVPSGRTSRIQEGHLAILHTLCHLVDEELFPAKKKK